MTKLQAGEAGRWMAVRVGNAWQLVFSTKEAAERLSYTENHVRALCQSGKLVATFEYGRWWVHEQVYKGINVYMLPF